MRFDGVLVLKFMSAGESQAQACTVCSTRNLRARHAKGFELKSNLNLVSLVHAEQKVLATYGLIDSQGQVEKMGFRFSLLPGSETCGNLPEVKRLPARSYATSVDNSLANNPCCVGQLTMLRKYQSACRPKGSGKVKEWPYAAHA